MLSSRQDKALKSSSDLVPARFLSILCSDVYKSKCSHRAGLAYIKICWAWVDTEQCSEPAVDLVFSWRRRGHAYEATTARMHIMSLSTGCILQGMFSTSMHPATLVLLACHTCISKHEQYHILHLATVHCIAVKAFQVLLATVTLRDILLLMQIPYTAV